MAKSGPPKLPAPLAADVIGSVSCEIDKGDLVAIVTSRAEAALHADLAAARREAAAQDAAAKKLRGDLADRLRADADRQLKPLLADLTTALWELVGGETRPEATATISVFVAVPNVPNKTRASITIKCQGRGEPPLTRDFPFDEAAEAQARRIADCEAAAREARAHAVEARARLANLPTLERQIRARLAEQKLRATAGGEALLALLVGDMEEQIRRLPGV